MDILSFVFNLYSIPARIWSKFNAFRFQFHKFSIFKCGAWQEISCRDCCWISLEPWQASGRGGLIGDQGEATLHVLCGIVGAAIDALEPNEMEFGLGSLQERSIYADVAQCGVSCTDKGLTLWQSLQKMCTR